MLKICFSCTCFGAMVTHQIFIHFLKHYSDISPYIYIYFFLLFLAFSILFFLFHRFTSFCLIWTSPRPFSCLLCCLFCFIFLSWILFTHHNCSEKLLFSSHFAHGHHKYPRTICTGRSFAVWIQHVYRPYFISKHSTQSGWQFAVLSLLKPLIIFTHWFPTQFFKEKIKSFRYEFLEYAGNNFLFSIVHYLSIEKKKERDRKSERERERD